MRFLISSRHSCPNKRISSMLINTIGSTIDIRLVAVLVDPSVSVEHYLDNKSIVFYRIRRVVKLPIR